MEELPPLSSHNGTGTMLLGIRVQPDGGFYATAWDVWTNMPIRPRSRHRLRALSSEFRSHAIGATYHFHDHASLDVVENTELVASEARMTRIWHWVIAPTVLLLIPAALCLFGWDCSETTVGRKPDAPDRGLRDHGWPKTGRP